MMHNLAYTVCLILILMTVMYMELEKRLIKIVLAFLSA